MSASETSLPTSQRRPARPFSSTASASAPRWIALGVLLAELSPGLLQGVSQKRTVATPGSSWYCSKQSHCHTSARSYLSAGMSFVPSAR